MKIDILFRCEEQCIPLNFNDNGNKLELTFANYQQIISHTAERYDGDYQVIPKVENQVLPTNQKFMNDDVEVLAIPYFEVSNDFGGNTVTIG